MGISSFGHFSEKLDIEAQTFHRPLQIFPLAELDRFCSYGGGGRSGTTRRHPCVVTGDFNLLPESGVLDFLLRGSIDYYGLCKRKMTQDKSRNAGKKFQEPLLPKSLGITDQCQVSKL